MILDQRSPECTPRNSLLKASVGTKNPSQKVTGQLLEEKRYVIRRKNIFSPAMLVPPFILRNTWTNMDEMAKCRWIHTCHCISSVHSQPSGGCTDWGAPCTNATAPSWGSGLLHWITYQYLHRIIITALWVSVSSFSKKMYLLQDKSCTFPTLFYQVRQRI